MIHPMKKPGIFLSLLLAALPLHAQTSTPKSSTETQEDIGDIKPAPEDSELPRFRATGQMISEFTSNAKLSGNHTSGDVFWLPSVEVGYNVPLDKHFSLDALLKTDTVLYSGYFDRSFYGFTGMTTLDYRWSQTSPRIYADIEPYWYQNYDSGDTLSSAIGFAGGIDHGIAINRGFSLLFWGYKFTDYEASPSADSRYQNRILLGITHQLRPGLYGQIYYSWQYSDYFNESRHDSRHVVGASLSYQVTKSLFGSFTTSLVDNDSNHRVASYQALTVALAATWQF